MLRICASRRVIKPHHTTVHSCSGSSGHPRIHTPARCRSCPFAQRSIRTAAPSYPHTFVRMPTDACPSPCNGSLAQRRGATSAPRRQYITGTVVQLLIRKSAQSYHRTCMHQLVGESVHSYNASVSHWCNSSPVRAYTSSSSRRHQRVGAVVHGFIRAAAHWCANPFIHNRSGAFTP